MHPLNQNDPYDVEDLRRLAAEEGVVLGETGLDYYYTPETKVRQQESFIHHIQIGREPNKPVIVHTRDARADTLAILREEKVTDCGGVLHCFTEDRETAGKLLISDFTSPFRHCDLRNAEQLRDAARYVPPGSVTGWKLTTFTLRQYRIEEKRINLRWFVTLQNTWLC